MGDAGENRAGLGADRLGEALLADGKVTRAQLEQALAVQRRDQRQLGSILLSAGFVSPADMAMALAKRLRLEYVELTEKDVDRTLTSVVETRVLRKHNMLPLRLEDGHLVVATSDPTNLYAIEDLRMLSGYPIKPVVAAEEELQRVFNRVYALGGDVTKMLEDAAVKAPHPDPGVVEIGDHTNAGNAPVIRLVGSILQRAVGEGASDIHFEPRADELTVRVRVDGVLRKIMGVPLKLQNGVLARLKVLADLDIAERRVPQDGRFSVKLGARKLDLRAAILPTVFGEKVVLRLLDASNAQADLAHLGFPPGLLRRYEGIYTRPYGAVLVTGPTGSGKSTTLYATLEELNSPEKNIITVEDPVEYRMAGVNQVQANPKVGLTFASGLRSILRADPDVVMIGEIRDRETAKTSVEAALTGHLVLATLHTNNAPSAITRLTDMGVEPFLTSSAVDCVIAQRLVRRLCGRCKRPVELGEEALAAIGFPADGFAEDGTDFHGAVGCEWCSGTGYRERIGVYEMMVITDEIRELVLGRTSSDEIGRAAEASGMVRLREDGLRKAAAGITTVEEVLRAVV